jgi:cobalt-zinc-cadmium efflux system outer membrane protein
MKFIKTLVCAGMIFTCRYAASQTDTTYLSPAQAEDLFVSQNLLLIAEKLNIDLADAAVVQARLWSNPTLTIADVNIRTTGERQFAAALEQIIVTGGKRRKLVEMESATRDIAVLYFEELLRSLKVELRNACAEMLYMQEYRTTLEKQCASLEALAGNYRSQAAHGNVSRSELLRLQASLLAVRSEINGMQRDMNMQQKNLKMLLNISAPGHIVITATQTTAKPPEGLSYSRLFELAEASRPDLKEAMFKMDFAEKSLRYERAQRTPDIALSAAYDRAGGIAPNFFGFGASIDLPLFDRNQGNIRAAQTGVQQSRLYAEQKHLEICNEIIHAMQNYTLAYNFNRQIADDYISGIDEMLESYTRNFISRNIGVVEFLDFFEAYSENKRIVLEAQKEVKISFEELQYAVGAEL